jgi:transcription termination/antitermination protein NusG
VTDQTYNAGDEVLRDDASGSAQPPVAAHAQEADQPRSADVTSATPAESSPVEGSGVHAQGLTSSEGRAGSEPQAEQEVAPPAPAPKRAPRPVREGPIEETPVLEEPPKLQWYILKVQSNREDSIREGLLRRVAIAGLDKYFDQVIVPIEMVSEFKGGKKRVVKRKLYPGYLVVHMEINEDTWFLVRETPGIGDFTGAAGKPSPMSPQEVAKIVAKQEEKSDEAPKLKIAFAVGDRVKINEGTFENFEGEVDSIDEASGRVTVMINIFGRSTPVELEYWQIESL